MWGKPSELRKLQVWLWPFAARIVQGITELKARHSKAAKLLGLMVYPCIGCESDLPLQRTEHNLKEGECKFHGHPRAASEMKWTCPGCTRVNPDGKIRPRPRGHHEHTNDPATCRMRWIQERRWAPRIREEAHPREARTPAQEDPDGNATSHDLDVARPEPDLADSEPRGAASSDNPDGSIESSRTTRVAGRTGSRGEQGASDVPRPPIVREFPDSTDPSGSDWTKFSIDKSLRLLKTNTNNEVRKKELRKLHLRWFHAPRAPMERALRAAGLDEDVISWIPEIIDTCRACRAWSSPGDATQAAVDLATKQNELLEADIMFYKTFKIWHMIDKCDRFHNGTEIQRKDAESLMAAIAKAWIQLFGPFKFLIIDGEKGIADEKTVQYLKRLGIEIRERANNQHANMIERRAQILRHCLHTCETQLEKEGIKQEFAVLLAECIFAGNAFCNVGGVSPYTCRFGTTPAMLPDLNAPPSDDIPGVGLNMQRVREIAVQKMVETNAPMGVNHHINKSP